MGKTVEGPTWGTGFHVVEVLYRVFMKTVQRRNGIGLVIVHLLFYSAVGL